MLKRDPLTNGGSLWPTNSRYVLKVNVEYPRPSSWQAEENLGDSQEITLRAALTWIKLADKWVVIRIPDSMDHNSSEYAEFREQAAKEVEERQRSQYESLKRKFER